MKVSPALPEASKRVYGVLEMVLKNDNLGIALLEIENYLTL